MHHRRIPIALALLAAPTLVGCNAHPIEPICYQHYAESTTEVSLESQRKVDILFVIDDSGSMGREQGTLAANFGVLVEQLESLEVDADYRIAITTTESGNAHCINGDGEVGAMRMRSCLSHLDDFEFAGNDQRDIACRAQCPAELADLVPLPTALAEGGVEKPRPWLQRTRAGSNVPEGITTAQALACWGPQGIDGCGYESPLESMLTALERSDDASDEGAGFLREDALLQVVIITDEADCSATALGEAAFDPNGSRALWPDDPALTQAPSSVCWSAGVACESMPDGRTHCEAADLDLSGEATTPEGAVLHPLSRYIERLWAIDARKRERQGSDQQQVLLSVIAGVPPGYAGEPLDYGPGDDPSFRGNFGVGPGCRTDQGDGVPPVRLLAMADAFGDVDGTNLFSICDGDYRPALEAIGERLIEQLSKPTCLDGGELGSELVEQGKATHCYVERRVGLDLAPVPTCDQRDGAWALPAGVEVCSYAVVDGEVHPTCAGGEKDIELRYLQAPGVEFGSVEVTCAVDPGSSCG